MTTAISRIAHDRKLSLQEWNGEGLRRSKVDLIIVKTHKRRIQMSEKLAVSEYDNASDELSKAEVRLERAIDKLVDAEKSVTERAKYAVSRAKEMANQITDSLARVNKVLGADFEGRLAQMERMANALEKLAELEKTGQLQGVIAALTK